jgi:galactitol-specific phosphotransferase system IIB component
VKVLCLCGYGNVRSGCLSRQLKDYYYQDSIAAGLVANSRSTLQMLVDWADVILIACELNAADYVDNIAHKKVYDFNPGPDRFQIPSHSELVEFMTAKIEQSGLFPSRRIV